MVFIKECSLAPLGDAGCEPDRVVGCAERFVGKGETVGKVDNTARPEIFGFRGRDGIGPLARPAINLMPSEVVSWMSLLFSMGASRVLNVPAAARREDQLASISDPHVQSIGLSFAQGHGRPHDDKSRTLHVGMILQFRHRQTPLFRFRQEALKDHVHGPGTFVGREESRGRSWHVASLGAGAEQSDGRDQHHGSAGPCKSRYAIRPIRTRSAHRLASRTRASTRVSKLAA